MASLVLPCSHCSYCGSPIHLGLPRSKACRRKVMFHLRSMQHRHSGVTHAWSPWRMTDSASRYRIFELKCARDGRRTTCISCSPVRTKSSYLKPNPNTQQETYELWNWDVAEAFIGSDFDVIQRYKEFEVSPQGEWVDLDIDLRKPHHEDGWKWNSHFESAARIDKTNHVWYAAMRIPFSAIDTRPATAGNTLRINLFLSEGPPSSHREIAWQSTMNESFHVPERFGLIRLVNK